MIEIKSFLSWGSRLSGVGGLCGWIIGLVGWEKEVEKYQTKVFRLQNLISSTYIPTVCIVQNISQASQAANAIWNNLIWNKL